jgi:hypothetical protein
MKKVDYKKKLKHLYSPSSKKVVIVEVPPMNYLMVDGEGGPAAESYQQAIEALYGLSFTVKFDVKKGRRPGLYGHATGRALVGKRYDSFFLG